MVRRHGVFAAALLIMVAPWVSEVRAADSDTSSTSKDDLKIACGAAENACVQTCPQQYDNGASGFSHDLYVDLCNDGCIQAYSKCLAGIASFKVKKNNDRTKLGKQPQLLQSP